MNLLTNDEVEKSIQHLSQIKQLMRDGKVAKSEKDVKSGLPKLVFTERTADELLQAMLTIKHHKSKVEEMQKTLEWYADENNYEMVETHINEYSSETTSEAWKDSGERARQVLKGETK